jgi:hypothetical protein
MQLSNFPSFKNYFRLITLTVILGVSAIPAWADVEGKNLQAFTLRQIDYLIKRADQEEPFDLQMQKTVDKIALNLKILSGYVNGPLQIQDFERITERLYNAAEDWDNAQLINTKIGLRKAKALLGSFAF